MNRADLLFWLLVVASSAWIAYKTFCYARATKEMRRSMRQAWWIRRRWFRLSRMLGLTVTDPTPTFLRALLNRMRGDDALPAARLLVPKIRVKADDYGVIVHARTLPKVGRDDWLKNADHLANAWAVRVSQSSRTVLGSFAFVPSAATP